MKYGLGIYDLNDCGNLDYKQRLAVYKNLGFHEIALYLDSKYMCQDESYVDIINYARKLGLKIKQVHIDYEFANLICDKTTNAYFDYLESKANECCNLKIPYMVLHASKSFNPPQVDDLQLQKLANVVDKYEDVVFCFENVKNNYNLDQILSLNKKNIKMCYDLGHAHAYGNEVELFEKYKKYIICSHLHNNYGKDDHNTLKDGEIDYINIVEQLSNIKGASNCIEAFPGRDVVLDKQGFIDFVKKCTIV